MNSVDNIKLGDCCYFLVKGSNVPKFGEIYKISEDKSIVYVLEVKDSRYYSVYFENFAWNKEDLKDKVWIDPHNYNKTAEIVNEKEIIERSSDVHNRKKTPDSDKRRIKKSKSPSRRNGSKQKSLRSS